MSTSFKSMAKAVELSGFICASYQMFVTIGIHSSRNHIDEPTMQDSREHTRRPAINLDTILMLSL